MIMNFCLLDIESSGKIDLHEGAVFLVAIDSRIPVKLIPLHQLLN